MLCLLMSLKLNLTIAGSRFLGVCACLGMGVLCQAGGEGVNEGMEIAEEFLFFIIK